jgi:hypothetical protein
VPPPSRPPWTLVDFLDQLDRWVEQECPPQEVRIAATAWIFTRCDDPYQGVRREPQFENLWYGPIPDTDVGDTVVQCAYWINERTRTVRCDSFATLSRPL